MAEQLDRSTVVLAHERQRLLGVNRGALWGVRLDRIAMVPLPENYAIAEDSASNAMEIARCAQEPVAVIEQRFSRGMRVWTATAGSEVAAQTWMSVDEEWAPPLDRSLRLASDECWGSSAVVATAHRGRRLFTALLCAANRQMAEEGRLVGWGGVLSQNEASQHSNVAAGFQPILHVVARVERTHSVLSHYPVDGADPRLVERAIALFDID